MKRKIDWSQAVTFILDELFYTQKELAKICNVTQQSISNWKMEIRSPGPSAKRQLIRLIEKDGLRINTFYTDYDPKKHSNQDDSLKELVELFTTLPQQRKEFILELTRFEHKQNV